MRIKSITITNLGPFESFTANFPAVAIITGPHGVGKSSLENIIKYALGRRPLATNSRGIEHDLKILKTGTDRGEAVITFDEGEIESLRVTVTKTSTERKIKTRGGKAWQAAGSGIDEITSALAYDPMQFGKLAPKERLEAFLRVVPVNVTKQEIEDAVAGAMPVAGDPGLDTINSMYEDIYAARSRCNASADTQEKYALGLESTLPPPTTSGDNWANEARKFRQDHIVLEESEQEELGRIAAELQTKRVKNADKQAAENQGIDVEAAGLIDEVEKRIAEMREQQARIRTGVATAKGLTAKERSDADATAQSDADRESREIQSSNAPRKAELMAQITTAEERSAAMQRAAGAREAATRARSEASLAKAASAEMTQALVNLQGLKSTVAGRMSIKGVTIASPREGLPVDICREEEGGLVGFESWNDADKDTFCLRMAILHKGPCGLVCIDNMGNWSPARQEAIISQCRDYAAEDGMQFILGRASDAGSLQIVEV